MTFAQPWLLLGALAALIPLAVHLFDRRKPRPHPFAAIAFVLRSQRRTASRLKLKKVQVFDVRNSSGVMPSDHRPLMATYEVK